MNTKFSRREKIAWIIAMIAGLMSIPSLVLLFIVIISYNETLVILSYNLAYIIIFLAAVTVILTAFAVGFKKSQNNGGLEILRYRSGKLAAIVLVGAFVVIAFARVEIYQHEIQTGIRNADGTIVRAQE